MYGGTVQYYFQIQKTSQNSEVLRKRSDPDFFLPRSQTFLILTFTARNAGFESKEMSTYWRNADTWRGTTVTTRRKVWKIPAKTHSELTRCNRKATQGTCATFFYRSRAHSKCLTIGPWSHMLQFRRMACSSKEKWRKSAPTVNEPFTKDVQNK